MPDQPQLDVQLVDHPVHCVAWEPFPQPAGAECVFLGRTRVEHHPRHGVLRRLTYHGYRPLARKVLTALAEEAARRYDCRAVRVHHALGEVPAGEASVLVQVVSGHRGDAFEACRFVIDHLKQRAPIWKQEQWADGTSWSEGVTVTGPDPS